MNRAVLEDRPILATVEVVYLAVSALADAAFHVAFQRYIDVGIFDARLLRFCDGELVHDRGADYHADGVCRIYVSLGEEGGDDTRVSLPTRIAAIDGLEKFDVVALAPLGELIGKYPVGREFSRRTG